MSTGTDIMTENNKSSSGMDDLKLWMVGMREQTNAMFAEMNEQMGRNENTSAQLDLKIDQNNPHMEQQITDIATMVDDRDDDAKIRERKVDDEMHKLDIKIKKLKQAAAEDLRRTREDCQQLIRPVPSTSQSIDTDGSSAAFDKKSTNSRDELKLWMVGMKEQTNAMFAEMHERMGKGETTSAQLDVKVDRKHSHVQQQITDITTMVDDRDEDAKIREQKVNDAMQQLDIKIQKLKQAAADDLRRTREERQKGISEVDSRTERLEQVQSDQTRALLELQNITHGDHRETNSRLQQLENRIATVSPAMISPKESPMSIEGIYRIPDWTEIETTAFWCHEPGMTFSNKPHASDHESLQSLHEGTVGIMTSRKVFCHQSCRLRL